MNIQKKRCLLVFQKLPWDPLSHVKLLHTLFLERSLLTFSGEEDNNGFAFLSFLLGLSNW